MKPFNLEEYLADPTQKVISRQGEPIEITKTDGRGPFVVVGYIGDESVPRCWLENGHYFNDGTEFDFDIFFMDNDEASEDERIRSGLIRYLESDRDCQPCQDISFYEEAIAYLERQKEQKPAEWSEVDKIILEGSCDALEILCNWLKSLRPLPKQEQPEVELDKLVNEEFASHSRTTDYGLEVTYNRAELYQLIKRMALLFNARKEK